MYIDDNEDKVLSQPYEKWATAKVTKEDRSKNRTRRIGSIFGEVIFVLVLMSHLAVFIQSVSALWGWYFIDIGAFIMMLALATDNRRHLKMVLLRRVLLRPREEFMAWYFFSLLAASVLFNLAFLTMYSFGIYEPPFGH